MFAFSGNENKQLTEEQKELAKLSDEKLCSIKRDGENRMLQSEIRKIHEQSKAAKEVQECLKS
jgi:hypothetical protein